MANIVAKFYYSNQKDVKIFKDSDTRITATQVWKVSTENPINFCEQMCNDLHAQGWSYFVQKNK